MYVWYTIQYCTKSVQLIHWFYLTTMSSVPSIRQDYYWLVHCFRVEWATRVLIKHVVKCGVYLYFFSTLTASQTTKTAAARITAAGHGFMSSAVVVVVDCYCCRFRCWEHYLVFRVVRSSRFIAQAPKKNRLKLGLDGAGFTRQIYIYI